MPSNKIYRYYSILIPVLIFILLASCGQHPCAKGDLRYRLIGFSDAEADTIVLRRLQKNTSSVQDSFIFNENNPIRFTRFTDTLIMTSYSSTALLQSDYDYQLYFPAAARVISITGIQEEQSYGTRSGLFGSTGGCINIITGCIVDGVPVNAVVFPNTIYLRK